MIVIVMVIFTIFEVFALNYVFLLISASLVTDNMPYDTQRVNFLF